MKLIHTLKADILYTIKSKELYIAIVGILGALWLPAYVELRSGVTSDAIYFLWISTDFSAFNILIIAFSAFPFAFSYISDNEQKIVWSKISRVGLLRYCISKSITSVIFTMVTVVFGMILLVLGLSIKLPLFDGSADRGFAFSQFLVNGQPIHYVLATIWSISLFCACWAMVALCISTIFQNKSYVISIVIFGYFLFGDLSNLLKIPYRFQIIPIGWGQVEFSGPRTALVIGTVTFGVMIAILMYVFYLGVRRKIADA